MKISNSKKQLARIISENGGWPCNAEYSSQDGSDGHVSFYKSGMPIYNKLSKIWIAPGSCVHMYGSRIKGLGRVGVIKNFHQTILSRAEYLHLYPAPDADGWIEWNGGECPVGCGAAVYLKWSDGFEPKAAKPQAFRWQHLDSHANIIAYRLHKPDYGVKVTIENQTSCHPTVTDGQTIEQLAADYRNAKDYAERKQQEADVAKTDADMALVVLERAGEALGLLVSPITAKQHPELVITDWRDLRCGDQIQCIGDNWDPSCEGVVKTVLNIETPEYEGSMNIEVDSCWGSGFKFIRRP